MATPLLAQGPRAAARSSIVPGTARSGASGWLHALALALSGEKDEKRERRSGATAQSQTSNGCSPAPFAVLRAWMMSFVQCAATCGGRCDQHKARLIPARKRKRDGGS